MRLDLTPTFCLSITSESFNKAEKTRTKLKWTAQRERNKKAINLFVESRQNSLLKKKPVMRQDTIGRAFQQMWNVMRLRYMQML